ncbi:MAG: acylneuraminate cytidylyltransferase family protein [Tannerellaceae bacterium]|nr:acylneuraminate cytidylyltransferase family protein [Tannerellaceae bacterium]
MKVVALIPIKMNNERTPGKNTKRFDDGTPLIHCIENTLINSRKIDDVYVYCSKEDIKDYLLPGVKYLRRDIKYDASNADVNDMFHAFSEEVSADIYVLAHATAPFQEVSSIERGIEAVSSGTYDSALAVRKIQDFVWKSGKALNYSPQNIPRTQDLEPLYIETTGLYIYTNEVISILRRRIGNRPYLIEVDEIEATDINNPIDFEIANALYMEIYRKKKQL